MASVLPTKPAPSLQDSKPATTEDIEMAPPLQSATQFTPAKVDDPFLVAFSDTDPENPLNWSKSRKWAVTDVLSATGFVRIMVSTIMAPALPRIQAELDMDATQAALALSIFLLATAFGPLLIGPLSEVYGRRTILHASNAWFLVWNIVCGFAPSKEVLIAARFLAGFGASAIYSLAGGVLGDVWRPEERGKSLAMYLLIPLLGAAIGPIIGGFMADRTTWRWMFWSTSIFQGVMIFVAYTTFRETASPYLLQKKAEELRKRTGDARYQTALERLQGSGTSNRASVFAILTRALTRPLRLLIFHPIIQITAVLWGFEYGLLYVFLSSFASLWTEKYGTSLEMSGLHYIAIALGELAGSQLGATIMDRLYAYMRARHAMREEAVPEHRLLMMVPAAAIASVGMLTYGWTAQYLVHWAVVDMGIFLAMFGGQIVGMPLQAYAIDVYAEHTSSAMAATQFPRSLAAFLFPLFAPSMYQAMGYGWGNSLLSLANMLLWLAAPVILWVYGPRLRARAISTY